MPILHIKPTAAKDSVFRFKSNFIRYYRDLSRESKPIVSVLTEGVETTGDGIAESASNIGGEIAAMTVAHEKALLAEIKALLVRSAAELDIPLPR